MFRRNQYIYKKSRIEEVKPFYVEHRTKLLKKIYEIGEIKKRVKINW